MNGSKYTITSKRLFKPVIANGKLLWLKRYYVLEERVPMNIDGEDANLLIERYFKTFKEANDKLSQLLSL
jgi:hypothetical protein